MPPNNDTATADRGTSSPKGGRGIANKGVPRPEPPEINMPERAVVHPVIPGRLYKAEGLNIGRDDFSQRGIAEGLSQVANAYKPGSHIIITGSESPSVHKGDPDLPKKRAEAAKKALVEKYHIPPNAIETKASPPSKDDPRKMKPEQKAEMRGAMFEVVPAEKVKYSPKGFTDGITYVKGEKKGIDWPPPIPWPPGTHWPPSWPFGGGDGGPSLLGILPVVGLVSGGSIANLIACAGMSSYEDFKKVIQIAESAFGSGRQFGPAGKWYEPSASDSSTVKRPPQHHVFAQEIESILKRYGINIHIHDFTSVVPPSFHNWLHTTGWNQVLLTFLHLTLGPLALPLSDALIKLMTERINCFVHLMRREWGIAELPLEKYLLTP